MRITPLLSLQGGRLLGAYHYPIYRLDLNLFSKCLQISEKLVSY